MKSPAPLRHLIVVLGDQLDPNSSAFDGFDSQQDLVWLCECPAEATQVWSHRQRIALFLSAMRHFAQEQRALGRPLRYFATDTHPYQQLREALAADLAALNPQRVILLEPGEWRLQQDFEQLARDSATTFEFREDRHFLCSRRDFADWMQGRKQPRMEHFYRWMRQRTGWLMHDGQPEGGQWNYDTDNRESFVTKGPGWLLKPSSFTPDTITTEVLDLVEKHYADHPGSLEHFDWPVSRADALVALEDFIAHRLAVFGPYQDAAWTGEPLLYHSRLAAAMNLRLLDPREVCEAAIAAFRKRLAPLASVEGFVRQILGWREYVRGLYWTRMPKYLEDNALDAQQPLPAFYWTGDTEFNCLRQTVGDTLRYGYAHHIQRLMITGLFALLLGVRPRLLHEWYLAVYADAVEWVELPNTIGMSQYADGGWMASKPYIASGKYIQRMSNYCTGCRFRPEQSSVADACPFTTLYWDFLDRHGARFAYHPRLKTQLTNLGRKSSEERKAITEAAEKLRAQMNDE